MAALGVLGATSLTDISALRSIVNPASLQYLNLEGSTAVRSLDDAAGLTGLTYLNLSESGEIESLGPLVGMQRLHTLYLHSSTRVVDGDLTPLLELPTLVDLRIQSRASCRPSVKELKTLKDLA